jgi:hypothetical protein
MDDIDWSDMAMRLDATGHTVLPALLTPDHCAALRAMYPQTALFRSRIVMARHGFGSGEYQYFAYPLPPLLQQLRETLYAHLAPLANRWNRQLNIPVIYPGTLQAFLARCHAAGQMKPTPLLLQYGAGDYNCLHQDLYGPHVFPLQVAILLSRPGQDFSGGEFVMTEQGTGAARADVVPLAQGDAVVFAVNQRPVAGKRGMRRVALRHGVSRLASGTRHTVGLIFHDAA